MSPRERRLAEVGVLAVMVLWAANFIVVKSAVAVLPPVGFTFLRFVIASATLLLLLRWREGSIDANPRLLLPDMMLTSKAHRVMHLPRYGPVVRARPLALRSR